MECINALTPGSAEAMRIDGYDQPIDLKVRLTIEEDRILSDWAGTSGIDAKDKCTVGLYRGLCVLCPEMCDCPEIPNNAASLAPFGITAPENTIVHALHPAPVALRRIGHMCQIRFLTRWTSCYQTGCQQKGRDVYVISSCKCAQDGMRLPLLMLGRRKC